MANKLLKKTWLAMALTLLCSTAMAQIYVWTDPATGKKVYSDQPPPPNVKDSQTKNFGGNVVSTSGLPFAVQDAMKRNPVVLYANKCDFCSKALALLNNRGVPFSQKNPETEPASADQLKKLVGSLEVPVLTVGPRVLKGFVESEWTAALDAAGYPKTSMKAIKGGAETGNAGKSSASSGAGATGSSNKSGGAATGSTSSTAPTGVKGGNTPVTLPPGE